MSNKPRNPRYFSKMKVRGARRRHLAPFQRTMGAFDRLAVTTTQSALAMQRLFGLIASQDSVAQPKLSV